VLLLHPANFASIADPREHTIGAIFRLIRELENPRFHDRYFRHLLLACFCFKSPANACSLLNSRWKHQTTEGDIVVALRRKTLTLVMALEMAKLLGVFLLLVQVSLQQKNPITDFCRRFGHQTAVIDQKLYIDGGMVDWKPISQNPANYSSMYILLSLRKLEFTRRDRYSDANVLFTP
jgi:hypothetical protein